MNLTNEAAVEAALSHLTALLGENEVITRFQQLQKRVAENDTLQQLEEGIKAHKRRGSVCPLWQTRSRTGSTERSGSSD